MKKKIKLVKNNKTTPINTIINQMNESRPLPMGRQAFEEWANRIMSGALVPHGDLPGDDYLLRESQKHAIASMIMHLGPTESHKPDAYFIHGLRKAAANQVAYVMMQEIQAEQKARAAKMEEIKKQMEAEQQKPELKVVEEVANEDRS